MERLINEKCKDSFLGKSIGITSQFKFATVEKDLGEAINKRKQGKMRKAKVLVQNTLVPTKPRTLEDMLVAEEKSQRSLHYIDHSSLSHKFSAIPKERGSSILTYDSKERAVPMGLPPTSKPKHKTLITV